MKRLLLSSFVLLSALCAEAQVGIGTTSPTATLDVRAANATGSTTGVDGILIPRVDRQRAQSMSGTPTGTLIYVDSIATGTASGTTAAVTAVGFYYYNGSAWTALGGASNAWNITGNSGIAPATNYIGTSTAVDVPFRRSASPAGRIGATSISFGVGALSAGSATTSSAFGNNALNTCTASGNVGVGQYALSVLTTGSNNVAVGNDALRNSNTSASWNTAVGTNALKSINNAAAQENTAVGYNAMANGTGLVSRGVAVGYEALLSNASTGIENTGVGYKAGSNITTGYNNTAIGSNAQVSVAANPNQVRIGNTAVTLAEVQVAWTITSDKHWKKEIKDSALGLEFIKSLRPVSYVRNNDEKNRTEYGFIAQEIEAAFIKANDPNNGVISKDDNGRLGVRYNDFIAITVKAMQEQQTQIETLQKKNDELQKTNEAIIKRLEALENKK